MLYCSDKQVDRAQKMLDSGESKKNRKNPNDPARFIGKTAVTEEGEAAAIQHHQDEKKISDEAGYDGLYAVCTDLLDDEVSDTLKVSEGRWQIEECFLICFLALTLYRFLEKQGFIPLYRRELITDDLHDYHTSYQR